MKYYLTEKGKQAKGGVWLYLRNPNRAWILRFMQKRRLKGYTLNEIQKGAGSLTKGDRGKYSAARELALITAREVRRMLRDSLLERR
ncbi:hypothetical protein LCGC14_0411990 [marine sediment metagenome]|uniref:Uncharacterized protein n=1 Tax=marine sediment metagenome TaxID=412755 RepID=A0A0F9TBR7_9ZZZZ